MKDTKTELDRIWETLADFSGLQGYDGWMIGSAMLRRTVREADDGVGSRIVPEADADDGVRSRITPVDVQTQEFGKNGRITEERRGNFAIMRNSVVCGNRQYALELHVVKPSRTDKNFEVAGTAEPITGELLDEYRFSASEILRFTEAVGDTNSIHRTAHPVVPGLLMFRRFLEQVESVAPDMPATWRMRFFDPFFAEETMQVYRRDEKNGRVCYCGYEKGRGVCIWNVHIS